MLSITLPAARDHRPRRRPQLPHGCAPGADLTTAEQRAALDAFAAMDADGDGELTADEIYQALSKNDADVSLARGPRRSSPRPTPTATAPCLARSTSTRSPLTSFREAGSAASAGASARSSPSRRPLRPPRRRAEADAPAAAGPRVAGGRRDRARARGGTGPRVPGRRGRARGGRQTGAEAVAQGEGG